MKRGCLSSIINQKRMESALSILNFACISFKTIPRFTQKFLKKTPTPMKSTEEFA